MKSDDLTYLSRYAHELGLDRGEMTPAERPELLWAPMRLESGVPVFDSARLRDDQVDDLIDWLERRVGRATRGTTLDRVMEWMETYGKFGARVQDVVEGANVSKKAALSALRKMAEAGMVSVRDEKTRGSGSPRKRYTYGGGAKDTTGESVEYQDVTLELITDYVSNSDTMIRHHGTAVQALTCGCVRCRWAAEDYTVGQMETLERQRGGTGFFAGLGRGSRA